MRVLVTGPTANTMGSLDGGWSYTWQGEEDDKYAAEKNTILEAIQQKIGKQNVLYEPGAAFDSLHNADADAAVAAANQADAIVLCLGESSYTESVGNIDDLNLPAAQTELALQLAKTGKPLILVLAEGRPRIVTLANNAAAATLTAYLPGNEGGNAVADILFGDVNPSGKLPFTYPRFPNALINYYRKNIENGGGAQGYNPLYEFGFGLSYTTFQYHNLRVDKHDLKDNDALTIDVDITNTGQRDGKETVLLFTSQLYASIAPDTKRLRAFNKIELKAGETKTVTFKITAKDLAYVNDNGKTAAEPGEFKILIADQTVSFHYTTTRPFHPQIDGKL
jgi:beta-glucosidase